MGNIRLIAFDIDGTVANSKKEISSSFFDFVDRLSPPVALKVQATQSL